MRRLSITTLPVRITAVWTACETEGRERKETKPAIHAARKETAQTADNRDERDYAERTQNGRIIRADIRRTRTRKIAETD